MRMTVAFAAGATLLLCACAQTPKQPEVAKAVAQENWVLIAPPERAVVVAFLEI